MVSSSLISWYSWSFKILDNLFLSNQVDKSTNNNNKKLMKTYNYCNICY